MNTRAGSRLRMGAVLALVTMLAAACGGGGTGDKAGGDGADKTVVRLGFSAWPGWFPWQVAEEKGLFRAAGVDVKLTYFESYTDSLNALNTGNLDANSQTLGDTISSVSGGAEQVVTLVNDNSTGNDQIIVAPGIEKIEDLKGKKVGAEEGTVDHFLLLLGLDKVGLKQSDIDFKPLATDAAAAAFAAGQLDAVGVFAPFTTTALERQGSKALFTSAEFPGAIPDHLVFGRAFVKDHPEEVQKLVDVWFDTLAYIAEHKDEAVAIMAKRGGVSVEDYAAYDKGTTLFTADQNVQAFAPGDDMSHLGFAGKRISAFLKEAGLVDEEPDLTGLLDGSFVEAHAKKG
ncbi:MAG: ABC transporter substrate-binding protein [Acidimicrobiales bacterium]